MILPLAKMNHVDIYIYGISKGIDSILLYLASLDVKVKGIICDEYNGRRECCGLDVLRTSEAHKRIEGKVLGIVVYQDMLRNQDRLRMVYRRGLRQIKRMKTEKKLRKIGINYCYFLSITEYAEMCVYPFHGLYEGRMQYYRSHIEELKKTYDMLSDDISQETMIEYVRTFVQSGHSKILQCDGRNKYFAGYGRGKDAEELHRHLKEEVWVNCGASVGDSVFLYFEDGYSAKRIYAYEGTKRTYNRLLNNLQKLPERYGEVIKPLNIFISDDTDWEGAIQEKITLINADIEGAEMSMLRAMRGRIVSDRPVLAICVYHKNADLVEIPAFISGIVDEYAYFLRKYSDGHSNPMHTSELVFYAIPKERLAINKNGDKRYLGTQSGKLNTLKGGAEV